MPREGIRAAARGQVYIGLNVDRSGDVPSAVLTSTMGPTGTDGKTHPSIASREHNGVVMQREFVGTDGTKLLPIAQAHTHNLTQDPGMKNGPGPSTDDVNASKNLQISIYPIESYSGAQAGGNNVSRVTPNGNSINFGTTNNTNFGSDALQQHVKK